MANGAHRGDLERELMRSLGTALDQLAAIWDEIGITSEQCQTRTEVVMVHLRNLLEEMVKEEESLRTRLQANVKKYTEDLERLTKELQLPPFTPEHGLSILLLERSLRTRVDTLSKEKHERMRMLRGLKERDQHLCDVLCSTPYYVPTGAVPSKDQLRELEAHIKELETERERRQGLFRTFKSSIVKMLEELDQCPNTSFERDIVADPEDSFLLSTDNMKALKHFHDQLEQRQKENFSQASRLRERCQQLWERLQLPEEERAHFLSKHTGFKPHTINALKEEISRCELLKLKNMQQVIEATRKELEDWWGKCFYSPEQRAAFKPFYSDDFNEECLEQHDKEVSVMQQYYQDNREMLERVARRQVLWAEFMEMERKAADPNRFFNRGCNLLKEEKARKKLMKELPRVEQEVGEFIEEWEKKNNKTFRVNGVRFMDFIKQQWEDFKVQRENEKEQRQQAKAKQTEEEMLYGSKPAPTTPGKRRFAGTPAKTPNKLRKIDPLHSNYPSSDSSSASTVSTTSSRADSTSSIGGKEKVKFKAPQQAAKRVAPATKQLNETGHKTPGSVSRLGRSAHTSAFSSPVCMPPRSAAKPKTPHRTYMSQPYPPPTSSRKVLGERSQANPASNDTVFSQTTVSSGGSAAGPQASDTSSSGSSVASVGPYNEFAKGLNQNARPNCRSSVVPKPNPGAYF